MFAHPPFLPPLLPLLLQEHAPALPGAPFSSQQYYSELRRVRRHTDPRVAGGRCSSPPQKGFLKEKRCRRDRTSTELILFAAPRAPGCPSVHARWHAERIVRVGALLASTPAALLVLFNLNPHGEMRGGFLTSAASRLRLLILGVWMEG